VADPLLAYARELEAEDAALAAALADVSALHGDARELHDRASSAHAFLAALPSERAAAAAAVDRAEREREERVTAARAAEDELEQAERSDKEKQILAARRAVVRTRDAAATAERKLERARGAHEALERETAAIERDLPELESRARDLAGRLAQLPRAAVGMPAPGLDATIDWAARAETALFVARSGLESERERVVRQANELGASALGEPLIAMSVSLVRERIERSRARS
jgi:hypothetical protein